jgi:WD40 repeat protein
MFPSGKWTAALLLGLGLPGAGPAEPPPDAAFTVKLKSRLEINDHRGRLSADGKTLFVEWWDGTGKLKALDAHTGKEVYAFAKEAHASDLSPDGKRLTAHFTEYRSPDRPPRGQKEFKGEARYYDEMKVWDVSNPRAPRQLALIEDASRPVFSPDGKALAVYTQRDGKPARHWELWGLEKGKRLAVFAAAVEADAAPVFSPDGTLLALPGPEAVKLYAAADGKEVRALAQKSSQRLYADGPCVLLARGGANPRLAFAPDGKLLAAGGDDGKVRLWDVASGRLAATLAGHSELHTFVRYSPDGRRLLTGSVGQTEVLRVAPGLPGRPPVTAKAKVIDPTKGDVILWDARTRAKERALPIRCPASLAWSADGTLLAVGDGPRPAQNRPAALQLWDPVRGQMLGTWPGFDEGQFSADGRSLLTSTHGRVVLWDVQRDVPK